MQPGTVTGPWTTAFWAGWLLVAGGFAAVWFSSRTTGLSTWWLGPESSPSVHYNLVPFITPIALGILAVRSTRYLPWYGLAGAVVTALIAVGDFGRVDRYALIELALAGAGLCVSAATFAGMLRAVDPADDGHNADSADDPDIDPDIDVVPTSDLVDG
jgi:hypothetical protein